MPQPLNPTIFVLEDDPDIAGLLKHHLQTAGYGVSWFPASGGLLDEMHARRPALVILDIMVPGNSGLDVAKSIRNNSALAGIPIVFVTARAAESDRLRGFELGGDDYITKPFSPKEVVARVKAVLRRFEQPLEKEIVQVGDLVIDTAAMRVSARQEPVVTTATEFRLIEFLATHTGRVFTRKALLDAVWHDTAFVTPRIVDVYIRRLREKIERDPEKPRHIHTVRGAGYMFEVRK
jgi:DNA-binding response OmpR family regulator